jgi:hypothetical protein
MENCLLNHFILCRGGDFFARADFHYSGQFQQYERFFFPGSAGARF